MLKKVIAAGLALTLMIAPASAALNQFYHVESGQWSIEGYYGDKNFCSAKSYWSSGSYVSLFNMKGTDKFSFIVHNTSWNLGGDYGEYYTGGMLFTGKIGSDGGPAPFELLGPQTIAFRDMTSAFMESWIKYRELKILMPNGIRDMTIGLSGTAAATEAFIDCIEHLNN